MRYRSPPDTGATFFALWSGSPHTNHDILVCVYNDEYRAHLCAEIMGCVVRPVTAGDLEVYLRWRRTLEPEAPLLDPLVSLYLHESAPMLALSRVIAYLTAHP